MSDDTHRKECVFCEETVAADAQLIVVTMNDYVGTPVGEDVPKRHVGVCLDHRDQLREVPYTDA